MTTTTTPSSTTTTKYCPCVLCGATIVATTEDDCLAHMQVCSTFHQVHPEGRATNPQAIYTTTKTKTSTSTTTTQKKKDSNYTNPPPHAGNIIDQGERDTENVHSSNRSRATMALPPSAPTITLATAAAAASPTNIAHNEDETRTAAIEASRGGIVEVEHMSVAQLRRYIQQAGLASDDCLEKSELQHRAHEATVRTSQNPFQ